MLSRPSREFEQESWLTRPRRWEIRGFIYRRLLAIPHWKRLLPSGARWLGGIRQEELVRTRPQHNALLAETRRAELAHWYMLLCTPVFFLWNPVWASLIMLIYGMGTNLPCILSQRFNRSRLVRVPKLQRPYRLP